MERSQVLDAMGQLKLYGMRTAYDEIIATAVSQLLFHLISKLYERTSIIVTTNLAFGE